MMKGTIKMKTSFDDSKNKIADMMLKGTVMGINELSQMQNEKKNLDEEVSALIEGLLKTEETYEKRLRKFL